MLLNEYDEQVIIQAIAKEAEEKGEKGDLLQRSPKI